MMISLLLLPASALPMSGHNKDKEFYIQPGYSTIISGAEMGIGGFLNGLNLEGNLFYGISESDQIYWNDHSGTTMPYCATYRPLGANIKVGYSFRLGERFRITPQAGCQYVALKETQVDTDIAGEYEEWAPKYDKAADKSNTLGISAGIRISVAILKNVGLSVTPQYVVKVSESDGYKALSEVSDKIKKYGEGFGCSINLNITF